MENQEKDLKNSETASTAKAGDTQSTTPPSDQTNDTVTNAVHPKNENKKNVTKTDLDKTMSMGDGFNLNLMPRPTQQQLKSRDQKENFQFISSIAIFLMTVVTIGIIGANVALNASIKNYENQTATVVSNLKSTSDKSLRIKTVNDQYSSISDLRQKDLQYSAFFTDVSSVASGVELEEISLNNLSQFELTGYSSTDTDFNDFVDDVKGLNSFDELFIDEFTALSPEEQDAVELVLGQSYDYQWTISGFYFNNNISAQTN